MSRSPLAYPLNRSSDSDAGGAADLQTDIMRFMAILSMCLLAIFALVQSIPLTPVDATVEPAEATARSIEVAAVPADAPADPAAGVNVLANKEPPPEKAATAVVLTRPEWVPQYTPETRSENTAAPPVASDPAPSEPVENTPGADDGFTLRFASDAALMRAVAAQHVGLYAIEQGRARRMTVSDSRISFWDASTPNTFHEMESGTVPLSVIEALDRAGAGNVSWGVTLPGRMKAQLDELTRTHRGGTLIITADGDIHWEAS